MTNVIPLRSHPRYRPTLRQVQCALLQEDVAYDIARWSHLIGKRAQHDKSGMRGRVGKLLAEEDVVMAELRTMWGKSYWLPAATLVVLDEPGTGGAA